MSRDKFRTHLNAERNYLRRLIDNLWGKIGKLLGYPQPSDHPHVRVLMDAVARLNARLRGHYLVSPERFGNNQMEVHAPTSTAPVPSFTQVALTLPAGGNTREVPRGTELYSTNSRGFPFRTCGKLTVRPVRVTAAASDRPSAFEDLPYGAREFATVVEFTLSTDHPGGFAAVTNLSPLRVHMTAEGFDPLPFEMYEALVGDLGGAWVRNDKSGDWFPLHIHRGGLGDGEHLLGDGVAEHGGERLLRDYFAFPHALLCVDLHGLDRAARPGGTTLRVVAACRSWRPGLKAVQADNLATNTVAAVNLKTVTLPPLEAGRASHFVDVPPSFDGLAAGAEVHAVRSVALAVNGETTQVPHWVPGRVAVEAAVPNGLRWHAERFAPDDRFPGGRVTVQLLDPAERPESLRRRTLHVTADVTNGLLPPEVRGVREYRTAGRLEAKVLRRPTTVLRPRLDAAEGYKAITLMTLNSLALLAPAAGARVLAGGLHALSLLDASADTANADEQARKLFVGALLAGLTAVRAERDDDWDGGPVAGRHYGLLLSNATGVPGSGFHFGAVLESFLGRTATFDTFVRTTVTTPTAAITWPANFGEVQS